MIHTLAMRPVLCPVLVGREEEARQLDAAVAGIRSGTGRTVLIAGEAGFGKSRLARQATETARQHGLAILTGRAVSGGTPTPFRPFAEALSSALRLIDLPDRAELEPFRPALGRLVPQLGPAGPGRDDGSLI